MILARPRREQFLKADGDFHLAVMALLGSGAAALGHEVLWTRRMLDLLGASVESSARVFECFFFGMSLGAAAICILMPKVRRPWRVLGFLEMGVAVLCLPALLLPEWTAWIWPSLGPENLVSWQGSVVKTVLSLFIVLPATFLMGMTLPVIALAVVTKEPRLLDRQIWLYSANTLGGACGLGLVVLFSLHFLGACGSMLLMVVINLAVAAKCFHRDLQSTASKNLSNLPYPQSGLAAAAPLSWELVLAFFSGAGVLSLEVLCLALANLSAPLSIYPQASVLVCVILLLAIAAWAVPKYIIRLGCPTRMLPVCLAATGIAISLVPVIFFSLASVRTGSFGYGQSFGQFLAMLVGGTFLALGPAVLLGGTIFPLLISQCAKGEMLPGRNLGKLIAASGVGGVVGAETAYRLLLPAFMVHVSIGVVGACYGLASLALLLVLRAKRTGQYLFPVVAFLGISYVTSSFLTNLPVYFQSEVFKVVDLKCGREGSLVVAEDGRGNRDMIFDNQYTLGGSAATASLRRQAHLPLLLHPAPSKVAFIGLGTGITASGALEHEAVKSVTAVELSGLVAKAAERDFRHFNHNICQDLRATVYVEDARIYLEAARGQFDVIVGDLFTPWRPGEASLGSLEQFQAARGALGTGGIFCQWIEMEQWTPQEFQVVAATFRKAFGHLYLFRAGLNASKLPVGLLGYKNGEPNWDTVVCRCEFEIRHGRLVDPMCRHPEGVAMLYLGEYIPPTDRSPISTLSNLRIELGASRQLAGGDPENYYSGSAAIWSNFLQNQLAGIESQKQLPERLRAYPRVGWRISAFELAVESNDPSTRSLAQGLLNQIPTVVAADSSADWSLWRDGSSPWAFLNLARPARPAKYAAPD